MPPVFAIVVALPIGVWVVIMIIGGIWWIIDQPRRLRERKKKREAKTQLAADLQAPKAPPSLPYGYSEAPTSSDADQQQ
jgi:hypothetical protein